MMLELIVYHLLLRVAKQPLPDLLKERIMDPINASQTWEWHGYKNSWINLEVGKCSQCPADRTGVEDYSSTLWIRRA